MRTFIVGLAGWDDCVCVIAVVVVITFNVASLERESTRPSCDIRVNIASLAYLHTLCQPEFQRSNTDSVYRHWIVVCELISNLIKVLLLSVQHHERSSAFRAHVSQTPNAGSLPADYGLCF